MVQLFIKLKTPGSTVPEMTIIELQGDLETRSQSSSLNGKFIGDLHFTKTEQPVLIVGHHILYGKVVRLEKPMAVVVKSSGGNADPVSISQKSGGDIFMDNSQTVSSPDQPSPSDNEVPIYHVTAVIRNKIIFKTRPRPIISNVPKRV